MFSAINFSLYFYYLSRNSRYHHCNVDRINGTLLRGAVLGILCCKPAYFNNLCSYCFGFTGKLCGFGKKHQCIKNMQQFLSDFYQYFRQMHPKTKTKLFTFFNYPYHQVRFTKDCLTTSLGLLLSISWRFL